jgi:hypothetical protein
MDQDGSVTSDATRRFPRLAEDDPRDLGAYQAFLDQARWVADWQWRRSESYERKAAAVVAFVGAILTLQTVVVGSIISVPRTMLAWITFVLLGLSAVSLVAAALDSIKVLATRNYRGPNLEQLRREWVKYKGNGHIPPEGTVSLFADQLLRESPGKAAPIQSLHDDAKARGEHFSNACTWLRRSIVLIALVLVVAALQHVVEEEGANGGTREGRVTVTVTTGTGPTSGSISSRRKSDRD